MTPKAKSTTFPFSSAGLRLRRGFMRLGLMCKESEVEEIWSQALEKPIDPVLVKEGAVQEVVCQGEELIRKWRPLQTADPNLHTGL